MVFTRPFFKPANSLVPGALLLLVAPLMAAIPLRAEITDAPKAPTTPIKVETIANGLQHPWALQFLDAGDFLITERGGRLLIVSHDGQQRTAVSGVPKVFARGQGGLLDVRLAPDFKTSNTLYLSFAEAVSGGKVRTAVASAKLDPTQADPRLTDVKVIWRQKPAVSTAYHFGSRIVIANDGSLFVTTGDRGRKSALAQDPGTTVGKVIRINPDGTPHADNPHLPGWAPEVWSIGHRNTQGAAYDAKSGKLWTVSHGARGGDELNQPQPGRNYGWAEISYGRHYSGLPIGVGTQADGMEQPVYYWDPSIAVSGLAIYRGNLFKNWDGNFLVGGLAGAQLARLVPKTTVAGVTIAAQEVLADGLGRRIRDVRQGPDGAVYLLTDHPNGELLRITPKN